MPVTPARRGRPSATLFAIGMAICVALLVDIPSSSGQESAQRGPEHGLVGVWEGTTIAICPGSARSRCNAHQKVTITLVEGPGSELGGYYKCAYGNSVCYDMNDTGKVNSVKLSGGRLWLRVIMPDGTSCIFNARIAGNDANGGYSCSKGGGVFERGSWRAKRQY